MLRTFLLVGDSLVCPLVHHHPETIVELLSDAACLRIPLSDILFVYHDPLGF